MAGPSWGPPSGDVGGCPLPGSGSLDLPALACAAQITRWRLGSAEAIYATAGVRGGGANAPILTKARGATASLPTCKCSAESGRHFGPVAPGANGLPVVPPNGGAGSGALSVHLQCLRVGLHNLSCRWSGRTTAEDTRGTPRTTSLVGAATQARLYSIDVSTNRWHGFCNGGLLFRFFHAQRSETSPPWGSKPMGQHEDRNPTSSPEDGSRTPHGQSSQPPEAVTWNCRARRAASGGGGAMVKGWGSRIATAPLHVPWL